MNRKRPVLVLLATVGTCLLVGAASSLVTATAVTTWYPRLEKPAWTPPDAVFGPVWTVLYVFMGIAVWLVWRENARQAGRTAVRLFALQLALNALWSFLFFGLRRPGWAFVEIVLLWIAILATLVAFRRVHRWAAGLLVPYLLWVSYAVALNLAIWSMNR